MKKLLFLCLLCFGANLSAQAEGVLIVLHKSDHTAGFVDLKTNTTIGILPTGKNPHEVAVAPNQLTATITNYGSRNAPGNSLSVIDLVGLKVLKTIELDHSYPHGIVYLDDERVLVTAEGNKAVIIVNIMSGTTEYSINTHQEISHMLALSPDKDFAYIANIGSGSMSVIDLTEFKLVKNINTGKGAEGIATRTDLQEVWVTNRAENSISVINTKSLDIERSLESESFPIRIQFTPNMNFALVSNAQNGTLNIFDTKTYSMVKSIPMEVSSVEKSEQRLFQNFENSPVPVGILVHPTTPLVFVANTNADIITVIDLESQRIVHRIFTDKEPDGLGFYLPQSH
ncbi:MAG: YncE family protein [Flavobacteriaceae bacterium]|nr:YncE family protein [Flavobacteriaceae bacterium]